MATDGGLTPAGHSAKAGLQPANSTPEYLAAPRRRQERALWQCHLAGADGAAAQIVIQDRYATGKASPVVHATIQPQDLQCHGVNESEACPPLP